MCYVCLLSIFYTCKLLGSNMSTAMTSDSSEFEKHIERRQHVIIKQNKTDFFLWFKNSLCKRHFAKYFVVISLAHVACRKYYIERIKFYWECNTCNFKRFTVMCTVLSEEICVFGSHAVREGKILGNFLIFLHV